MAFFVIGAVVACVAKDILHMLIGRSLQGTGGGGMITLTAIVIAEIVPLRHRGQYFGILGAIWSLGTVIELVVGGSFTQKAS
jgi:MFS family permease